VRYLRSIGTETPLQDPVPELRFYAGLFRPINSLSTRLGISLPWLFAIVFVIVAGCGGSTEPEAVSPPATPVPLLSAKEVIEMSQSSMAALKSFSFELTHDEGATLLPGGFEIHESSGIVSAPDRVSLTADATFSGLFVKIDAVIFPDLTYMTNPLTGNWNLLHGDESPFAVFDPPSLISDILSEITTTEYSVDSDSNHFPIRLEGELPAFAMRNLVGGTDPDKTLDYLMEIDAEFRLLSVDLTGVIRSGEEPDVRRTIALGDFDVPVTIESPI